VRKNVLRKCAKNRMLDVRVCTTFGQCLYDSALQK
jgi:hypothetical protein